MHQVESNSILQLQSKIKFERISQVIDYEYDFYGNRVAVSDSEGNVVIYVKQGDRWLFHSDFKASNSSIWKVSWAHPKFGDVIAIGSFSKKVGIFQFKGNQWIQLAYHELHEASVNEVVWAPYYFGLKLYACSSDGSFSLLQIKDGNWISKLFKAHELSINSIAVQKKSILQNYKEFQQTYPNIITGSKDKTLSLWSYQQGQYKQKWSYTAHKEPIRKILWRQQSYRQPIVQIFSCSEDGTLKYIVVNNNQIIQKILLNEGNPIVKISQSSTGDLLIASFERNDQNTSLVLKDQQGQWVPIEQFINQ